jgi:hypothetical protein
VEAGPEGPEGPLVEVAPPEPPPRYGAAARVALVRGVAAFGAVMLLALILGALAPQEDAGVGDVLRMGGLQFYAFHRVPVRAELPTIDLSELQEAAGEGFPFGFGLQLSISASVAMLLATALGLWLLYRGGRAVTTAAGGRPFQALALGPVVAVPYAALSLVFAFVFAFGIEVPPDVPFLAGEEVRVAPSPLGALLWPLAIGAVAGILGGFAAVRDRVLPARHLPRALGALGGGWRMLVWALAICFLGLFWLSATNPDTFTGYFRLLGELPFREATNVVVATALVVPNMMVGLLFVGMGAPLAADAAIGPFSFDVVMSLLRWPREIDAAAVEGAGGLGPAGVPQLPVEYGIGPADWFFFVLAPLVGVVIGGRWAARRAGETSFGGAAAVGALAGIPFALGCLGLGVLAAVTMRVDHNVPLFAGGVLRLGPGLLLGGLIALVWGGLGGALGGSLLGRVPVPPAASPEEASGPPGTQPETREERDEPPTTGPITG